MHLRSLFLTGFSAAALAVSAQPPAAPNRTDAQGRKQGPWVRKWADSEQTRYTGQFKDGKPVGSFVYYSTKGNVESRIDHYADGNAAHGRHYHPNGKLMAEGRYVGEDKDSTWNYYDPQGILRDTEHWKAGKMDGAMTTYYPSGKVAEQRHFTAGVAQGPAEQFYANGAPRYKANYVDGSPEGIETFYFQNGNKEIEGNYVNGNRDGRWAYYNEDGSLQMQVQYAQGKFVKQKYENGSFKEYWEDGQTKSETTYKNGKRDGPFTEWYDNGTWTDMPVKLGPDGNAKADVERELKGQTKKHEGRYKNDVLDGPVKEYDETGKLISSTVYVNGEPSANGAGQ
jgi:antitoxin component YwqK of YwqJK toxin-antitoxin module